MTQLDISRLVHEQIQKTLTDYMSGLDLTTLIAESMQAAIDDAVERVIKRATESMLKDRNISSEITEMVLHNVRTSIEHHAAATAKTAIDQMDMRRIVSEKVTKTLEIDIKKFKFPDSSIPHSSIDWRGLCISADIIDGGIIQKFNSTGIQDDATTCQLTITDGVIVAENVIVSQEMRSQSAEFGKLAVKDARIDKLELGELARRNIAEIADHRIVERNKLDIDLTDRRIIVDGKTMMDGSGLGAGVMKSNIRKLGLLEDLRVGGIAKFSETLMVGDQGRVGINTEEPSGALTVWDDDAELTITKMGKRRMFVGSTRTGDLSLGTNQRSQLNITSNEISMEDAIRVQGIRFSVEDRIPERVGEPLEIVMVRRASAGQPMFYMCEGSNRWRGIAWALPS